MLWSLIFQLMIDLLLVSVVAWLWLQQKKSPAALPAQARGMNNVDAKILEMEQTINELRASLIEGQRQIQSLHDRIQKLIEQGALTSVIFPMSREEEELKSLSTPPRKEEEIPTLKQMEATRERLRQDPFVDLRTILRDQLA